MKNHAFIYAYDDGRIFLQIYANGKPTKHEMTEAQAAWLNRVLAEILYRRANARENSK